MDGEHLDQGAFGFGEHLDRGAFGQRAFGPGSIWTGEHLDQGAFGLESIWFWGAFGWGAFNGEHLDGEHLVGSIWIWTSPLGQAIFEVFNGIL